MQGKKVQIVEDKLSKIVHQEGEGQLPQKGQEIFATYKGSLQNGTVFDSNQDRENPFNFVLGQGSVIKGWDQGFATMKRGEKATLICSPQYAYGAQGSPPSIPPNSTLNFEVQLLDFKDKKKEKWEFSDEQKFAEASRLKASGNDKLKAADLKGAAADYKEGIEFIENESSGQIKQLLNILRLNLSQAYLKLNRNAEAIENCTKVLKEQPANLKALYRRGVALHKTQDFEKAKIDFIELLKNDPQNAEAKKELAQINAAIKAFQQKQKKVFGQMFSKGGLYDDVKPAAKPETPKGENVEQLADQKEEQHQPQKEEQHQPQKEEQPEQKNEGHQKTD